MRRRLGLIALLSVVPLMAACAGVDTQLTSSQGLGGTPTTSGSRTGTPRTTDSPDTTDSNGTNSPDTTDTTTDVADVPDVTDQQASASSIDGMSYEDIIAKSVEDIETFWRDQYPAAYGSAYEELAGGVWAATPRSRNLPTCGDERVDYRVVQGNAFYCPLGDFIMYDDSELFPQIYDAYGPFVLSTILAHEWGHAIQNRAGVQEASITMEQQADCFAGAWTRWIADGNSNQGLTLAADQNDLNAAMAGFIAFKDPAGLVSSDTEGAHGSAFDRVGAFRDGYNNGVGQCATYPQDPPPTFEWPYQTQQDAYNQGNLPYDDLLDPTVQSLDRFWLQAYQAKNGDYASLAAGLKVYGGGMDAPTCDGKTLDSDITKGGIFYCQADDYIGFDEPGLMKPVYEAVGDFAVSLLIANAYAQRAQDQLGAKAEGKERSLQADCLSGAWVKDIYDRAQAGQDGFSLSPGDLDEGVQAFLRFADHASTDSGTPFERVDRFRTGFLQGLDACGL